MTPVSVRRKALEDFQKELKHLNPKHVGTLPVLNIKRSIEKLIQSLWENQTTMQEYEYVQESENGKPLPWSEKIEMEEISLESAQIQLKSDIFNAKYRLQKLGVNKSKFISVGDGAGKYSVIARTDPEFFPFDLANGVFYTSFNYDGFESITLYAYLDGIRIDTDLPFEKRELLLAIDPRLKQQLLDWYKKDLQWYKKKPFKEQQRTVEENTMVQQTIELVNRFNKELGSNNYSA